MNEIEKVLNSLERNRVEGHTFIYNGNEYAMPYQTISVGGVKIQGLREMDQRADLLLRSLDENKIDKDRYLDIGSNCGFFVNFFSTHFKTVIGVDYDDYYINLSKTIYPHGTFIKNDLNEKRLTQIFKQKFNFVTALSMIEYITNKEQFVADVYDLTDFAVFEGHSEDIDNKNDMKYEFILKNFSWSVTRLDFKSDAGINARIFTGRPIWICKK